MKLKLRGKIMGPVLVVVFLGLATVTVVSYITASRTLEQTHTEQMERVVQIVATQANDWIGERAANVNAIAAAPTIIDVLTNGAATGSAATGSAAPEVVDNANAYLQKMKESYPAFTTIGVLNREGIAAANSNPSL
ncbi:MAG: hypothetical protein WCY01_01965, partial [Alkalispirochaeta sp.]